MDLLMTKKKPSAKAIEMTDSFSEIWNNQRNNLVTIYLSRFLFKYYAKEYILFGMLSIPFTLYFILAMIKGPVSTFTINIAGVLFIIQLLLSDRYCGVLSNLALRFLFRKLVTIKSNEERPEFLIGLQRPFEKFFRNKLYQETGFYYCNAEVIIGVTFKHASGLIFYLERPMRHHNIFWTGINVGANRELQVNSEQGFLTNFGRYVGRKEAKLIAIRAKQLLPRHSESSDLFSECVWETPKGE
jgi:hypothetical protein